MSRPFRRVHRVKAFAKSNANRVRLVCWLVFEASLRRTSIVDQHIRSRSALFRRSL